MKRILLALFIAISAIHFSFAAGKFQGSFIIHADGVKASADKPTEMKVYVRGTELAIQPLTEMPGMPGKMRLLLNTQTKMITVLMDNNGNKMGMKMSTADQKAPDEIDKNLKVTDTKETKTIDGYKCHKIIAESDKEHSEIWVTDELGMNMADFTDIMGSQRGARGGNSGMAAMKNINGFPIEIKTFDKAKKSESNVHITSIKKDDISPEAFSTEGYQMMDMPAGGMPGR